MPVTPKLPKQIFHWIKKAGYRQDKGVYSRKYSFRYNREYKKYALGFKGRGHKIRLAVRGDTWVILGGERHDSFWQWPFNTVGHLPLPYTQKEFLTAVECLRTIALRQVHTAEEAGQQRN